MARQVKVQVGENWYIVEFLGAQGTRLQVRVNGQSTQVEVSGISLPSSLQTQRYSSAAPMQATGVTTDLGRKQPIAPSLDPKNITAPMNGRIVRIVTEVGAQVRAGDELCILEAMKMEQSIQTSIPGTIKEINVSEGQNVAAGEVLVELD